MNTARYTKTAVILHWLIALGIFIMFALGWFMTDLPKKGPDQTSFDLFNWGIFHWQTAEGISPRSFYYNLHKSIGVTILALVIIRILWRFTHKPPALLAGYKASERMIATWAHRCLYLLMLAMPVSGVIMASNSKYGIKWFGISFIVGADNKAAREFWVNTHQAIGLIVLIVIGLHILGALKHKLVDKDETLSRMML